MKKITIVLVAFALLTGSGCAALNADTTPTGASLGNFTLPNTKGKLVSLRDFSGKVILISFWTTGCDPCQVEMSLLQKTWERLRGDGFELIGINIDGPELTNNVRQMVHRYGYKFTTLLDKETEVVSRYNPKMDTPYSMLIDRKGKVAAVFQGYRSGDEAKIEKEIEKLLEK